MDLRADELKKDKEKSRRFFGGFALMCYFMAAYEYLYVRPGTHTRLSFLFVEEVFGPYGLVKLFLCFGTFCLFLLLVNERN